jgi:site-specific recombinase XerD
MTDLIDRHLAALRAEGRSPNTVVSREELLRRLARDLPQGLDEASTEELQQWLGNPRWCSKTRETYWCHLIAYFRWATRGSRPFLDYDPSADMPRPHVGRHLPRVASDDQLAFALDHLTRPVLRAVILAAGVGMRAGEVASAQREHFTKQRVIIHGKGDKMRMVPVPADVWEEVAACPDGPLVTHHGEPVDRQWVTMTASRALTSINLPRLTLHWFRGAYATRLRRSGVDTMAIAELLGHESVATTQRYVQVNEDDLAEAVARLPRLTESATRQPSVMFPDSAAMSEAGTPAEL